MFNKLTLKTKLIIPIFSITIILLLLGYMLISSKYSQILSLEKLNQKILLSSKISDVIHSLQKERGLSSGYSIKYSIKFKKKLMEQRDITDIRVNSFNEYLESIYSEEFKLLTKKIIFKINQLDSVRDQIDKHLVTSNGIIKYYTIVNHSLLDILINIIKESFVPEVTQKLLSYSYIMHAKEFAGIERAIGINLLLKKNLNQKDYIKFTDSISTQKQNIDMFLKYGSKQIKKYYYKITKDDVFDDVKEIRNIILYQKNSDEYVDSKYWYNIMTSKINSYQFLVKFIQDETIKSIKYELNAIYKAFYFVTGLTVLSMIIFIFMIIAFLRLASEEQRLRIVMDKYIISSITDTKGIIIDVSEAFCNISGYSKSELIGNNHNMIRHPDMDPKVFRTLWETLKKQEAWKGKVKNRKKDGSFYWVYSNIEPLRNAKGEIDSYISIRLDITESELLTQNLLLEEEKNKKAYQMMQQQSRLAQMGEMISMIAHQWRQPLAAISSTSSAIELKAKLNKLDSTLAIEFSNKISNYSAHLSSTIDDFRNFFKSNKIKSITDFEKILNSVLGIIKSSLEQNSIELDIIIQSNEPFETYENELKQVILNLIKNAEDILIENKVENPYINIEVDNNILIVSDNAGGIPEEIMDKIFDPYFSTKTKKDGTGLGLYMSKVIIEDHCDGSLSVINDNKGAKFTIILGEKS